MIELTAIADCWVNSNNPDKNLNKNGLGVGRWIYLNRSLLAFDLRNILVDPAEISAAELRLYGKVLYTPLIVEAHYTATSWSETTVTWNNQPPPTKYHSPSHPEGTSFMGSTTEVPSGAEGWFSLPIDIEFIQLRWGQKLWAILKGYEGAVDSYCYAEDREEAAYAPRLILHTEAPVGIPTTTTMSAPSKAAVNEKFNISGSLYETESSIKILGQPINHSYNGRSLGGSTTGVDGGYLKEVSIPESGVWTIKSEFPGTPEYAASRSVVEAMVAASPLEAAIKIAGSVAAGLALIMYSLS